MLDELKTDMHVVCGVVELLIGWFRLKSRILQENSHNKNQSIWNFWVCCFTQFQLFCFSCECSLSVVLKLFKNDWRYITYTPRHSKTHSHSQYSSNSLFLQFHIDLFTLLVDSNFLFVFSLFWLFSLFVNMFSSVFTMISAQSSCRRVVQNTTSMMNHHQIHQLQILNQKSKSTKKRRKIQQ